MRFNIYLSLVLFCLFLTKTSFAFVLPCLNGSYTIGGTTPDFATFSDAVTELESEGVCGPVVFEVRTGTYTEQISIPEITGASAVNTITFRSESGTNTDVILRFSSSGTFSDPNYTLQLNGSDYIHFENMTIERTGSSTYARVVDFSGDASQNVFDGNILTGRATGSTSNDNSAIVFTDEANPGIANNTFSNNEILYGFAGIVWESSNGNSKPRLTVLNNTFSNYRYGLLIDYATDLVITGNTIANNPTNYNSAQLKGIECFRCEDDLTISANTITLTDGTSNYGIDLQASVGNSGAVGVISNNMVIVGGTGTSHAINSGSLTSYKNYYHNSCYTTGTNATSSSAFYLNGSNNINIKNNAFFGTSGNAIEILTTSGVLSSDYNLLYSTGPYVGKWSSDQATLADYQTASGGDANSVSADPEFISSTNLHVATSSPADGAATAGLGVTVDIDGDVRSVSNPDIGADEVGTVITGLQETGTEFNIHVGANNVILLESADGANLHGMVEITDIAGRRIMSREMVITDGKGNLQTAGFSNGLYVITFVTEDGDRSASHKVGLFSK